jgi:RNA polymerase sigma factor (TIGR02999 family)
MSNAPDHSPDPLDAAQETLFLRLYAELRVIADRLLRREAPGHTLAARALRLVLVDSARRRRAAKRGGALVDMTLSDDRLGLVIPLDDLIAVDDALTRLAANDERLARVVELRFFAGLNEEEIAEALGVTSRTVQRDWAKARAWLHSELSGGPA